MTVPLFTLILLCSASPPAASDSVDFSRDVLPILSDNCFQCHGPDQKARKADLRLDEKVGAMSVLRPGNSADSELIQRLVAPEKARLMPPPKSNRRLTERQIATLKAWVDSGARWGTHWAFAPIQRPSGGNSSRVIDRLVEARLQRAGLTLLPEATREALIRRVTLDLTGLPPTLEEIDAFLTD